MQVMNIVASNGADQGTGPEVKSPAVAQADTKGERSNTGRDETFESVVEAGSERSKAAGANTSETAQMANPDSESSKPMQLVSNTVDGQIFHPEQLEALHALPAEDAAIAVDIELEDVSLEDMPIEWAMLAAPAQQSIPPVQTNLGLGENTISVEEIGLDEAALTQVDVAVADEGEAFVLSDGKPIMQPALAQVAPVAAASVQYAMMEGVDLSTDALSSADAFGLGADVQAGVEPIQPAGTTASVSLAAGTTLAPGVAEQAAPQIMAAQLQTDTEIDAAPVELQPAFQQSAAQVPVNSQASPTPTSLTMAAVEQDVQAADLGFEEPEITGGEATELEAAEQTTSASDVKPNSSTRADINTQASVAQNSFTSQMIDGANLALETAGAGFGAASRFVTQDMQSVSSLATAQNLPTGFSGHFSSQIAEVAQQLPDRPVEISLSPEELGKVKLTFQVSESGAMNVVIAAERPETLELMRRNADTLLSEFQSLGYESSSFEFQQEQQGDGQQAQGGFGSDEFASSQGVDTDGVNGSLSEQPVTPVQMALGSTGGMDLRL